MVTYNRFTSDGVPIKLESSSLNSTRDPVYRIYLEGHKMPVEQPLSAVHRVRISSHCHSAKGSETKRPVLSGFSAARQIGVLHLAAELGVQG